MLRRLNLVEALQKAGIDYLFVDSTPPAVVAPGTLVSYQVEVKSRRGGVRFSMESAPPGATLSPSGKFSWRVPAETTNARETVIITIRDASGQEIFHTFTLRIS